VSLRRRITLAASAAVAVVVVLASLLTYVLVRDQLRSEIDKQLTRRVPIGFAASDACGGTLPFIRIRPVAPGEAAPIVQCVQSTGDVLPADPTSGITLPAPSAVRVLARNGGGSLLFDANVNGEHLRVLAVGVSPGSAVEIGRSLAEVDSVLTRIRLILVLIAAAGIAVAAVLGRFVAGTALAPVRRLTAATEHVAETQDLGQRIEEGSRDELGRLATSFNEMLDALEKSMRAQRRLVADASHELRTPVTSIRTNIEILQAAHDMAPPDREKLIGDVVEQLEELSTLVGDLIELARDQEQTEAPETVRLDTLVEEAVARAQLHAPQARFSTELDETVVEGVPGRLDRAVNNLLSNAVKFGGTDQPVEVTLHDGELRVRDHGPGIDPADLPHVFDRFYRGATARALPGSGLGLAIVRQVAESHGGSVSAAPADGGGTVVSLKLAGAAPAPR
jgi:two-component system sensor histidine kinase MprB